MAVHSMADSVARPGQLGPGSAAAFSLLSSARIQLANAATQNQRRGPPARTRPASQHSSEIRLKAPTGSPCAARCR
jgi:hypothetical protein